MSRRSCASHERGAAAKPADFAPPSFDSAPRCALVAQADLTECAMGAGAPKSEPTADRALTNRQTAQRDSGKARGLRTKQSSQRRGDRQQLRESHLLWSDLSARWTARRGGGLGRPARRALPACRGSVASVSSPALLAEPSSSRSHESGSCRNLRDRSVNRR